MNRTLRRCFACVSLLAACTPSEPATPAAPAAAEAPEESARARFVAAESAQGSALFDAPARVLSTPDDSAVISAPLALRVSKVRVRPGQRVKQGEPLLDVMMPELIRAVGAHSAAELRIKGYEARRARLLPLVAEGLARAADAADLEAQIAMARADLESAHAVLRSAGVPEEQFSALVTQSGSMALRAPIAGVVVAVAARLGAMWQPNDGPLVELAKADSTLVEARFQVLPPEGVAFEWWGPEGAVPLRFDGVSPRALAEDGSRVVWLSAEHAASSLVPGAIGRVRAMPKASWTIVPASALSASDAGSAVFVEASGEARSTPVTLVRTSPSEAVVSGLAIGTRVRAVAAQRGAP